MSAVHGRISGFLFSAAILLSTNLLFAQTLSPAEQAMAARVDQLLQERWQEAGVQPAPISDDAEFLRRAYLDLTGIIPPVAEVRKFIVDTNPAKRAELIERLLSSPAHATHLAATWRRILLPRGFEPQEVENAVGLENWLRRQFADNLRYDNLVADFLVAQGDGRTGPALYYASLEVKPEKLAASTASIFLGLQIQCAQCHDHPHDHWKQTDFWGYAAFFAQLGQPPETDVPGATFRLSDTGVGEVKLPETETVVAPKFPDGDLAPSDDIGTRRSRLAIWMASRDNPYLPRAAANWAWSHLFGRGLVHPIDDQGPNNPPSHPQLLDELSQFLVRQQFDMRSLIRVLANTQSYQLSSRVNGDPPPPELFARMLPKTLNAEQLYDCLQRAAAMPRGNVEAFAAAASRLRDPMRLEFVSRMQSQTRDATDYQAGVPQALLLMNGPLISMAVDAKQSGLLRALTFPSFRDTDRIETMYLAALSRPPEPEELEVGLEYLKSAQAANESDVALGDMLWALLNSAEFALNH